MKKIPGKAVKSNFINKFHIVSNESYSRLLFGESIDNIDINYHIAVVMAYSDLKELSELLIKVINQINEKNSL